MRLTFARLAAAATDLPARTWLELGKGRQCEGERKARESVCVNERVRVRLRESESERESEKGAEKLPKKSKMVK